MGGCISRNEETVSIENGNSRPNSGKKSEESKKRLDKIAQEIHN